MQTPETTRVSFRTPTLLDASEIWRLTAESGVLDLNSRYSYLLWCRDFSETCVLACRDAQVVGFVTAYRPPPRPASVFVWQIAVAEEARGQGIAADLLHALLSLPACRDAAFLEATVTPSNNASRRLFQSFAESQNAACHIERGFTVAMFGGEDDHEQEDLFRIGPLRRPRSGE